MAPNSSQALELLHHNQEENKVHEVLATSLTPALSPPGKAPESTDPGIRVSPNPVFHTAFMQCRSCCNCDPNCSYYGKGLFDAQGNYVGS
jgi:hypothetical protein